MAEIDIVLVVPVVISIILPIALLIYKANQDAVHDLQKRVAFLEGRQAERDRGKGAV